MQRGRAVGWDRSGVEGRLRVPAAVMHLRVQRRRYRRLADETLRRRHG